MEKIKQKENRKELKTRSFFAIGVFLLLIVLSQNFIANSFGEKISQFLNFQISAAQAASAPSIITYQGKLLVNNLNATTTQSMKFVLYDSLTGGTALYTASGTLPTTSTISVTPSNGLFSVNLGDNGTNAIDPTIFQNNQSVYLEVTIGGETLSPRKQITASPYSYNSKYLDGIAATSTASTSTYIPISDGSGNFNFNNVMTTGLVSTGDISGQAIKDALGWLMNQANYGKLSLGMNSGGFGGGATPGATLKLADIKIATSTMADASAKGFNGAVFDGRYIYFVPGAFNSEFQSKVARYDTTANYNSVSSWSVFDIAGVSSTAKGFSGAVFDGQYVYFVPSQSSTTAPKYHGKVVRYDTRANFSLTNSWSVYDSSAVDSKSVGFAGAVFDGKYIYFIPARNNAEQYFSGVVTRYDTESAFTSGSSWSAYNGGGVVTLGGFNGGSFDGRYIYFIPHENDSGTGSGYMVRYDTSGSFTSTGSWASYNLTSINSNYKGFVGSVFDGRYLYLSPAYGRTTVLRFDTTATFAATSSWTAFNMQSANAALGAAASATNYYGGTFDGRYVYFVPFSETFYGYIAKLDTTQPFGNTASWSFVDVAEAGATSFFKGAVFDSRYIYLIPFNLSGILGYSTVVRIPGWSDGVDSTQSINKIARGSELYIDSSGRVGIGTTTPAGALQILNSTSTIPGLIVQGASGQSANLAEFRTSTGAILSYINQTGGGYFGGSVGIGTTTPGAALQIDTLSASGKGLIIRASTSTQSASLFEVQNYNNQDVSGNPNNPFFSIGSGGAVSMVVSSSAALSISKAQGIEHFSVNTVSGLTNAYTFASQNFSAVSAGNSKFDGSYVQFINGAIIQAYQQPLTIARAYGGSGAAVGLEIDAGTDGGSPIPSGFKLLTLQTDDVEKAFVDKDGQAYFAGNISIGAVSSTAAMLTISNGAIMASGTTGATPGSGAGTRLMWIPEKAAFRAGTVSGVAWDDGNIGVESAAFGQNSRASGGTSFAVGILSQASGNVSVALGNQAAASGDTSVAIGDKARASQLASMAFGSNVTSSGQYATAFGTQITVSGGYSVGIGLTSTPGILSAANTFAVVGGQSLFGTTTNPGTYQVFIDSGSSTTAALGAEGFIKASGYVTGSTTLDLAEQYPVDPNCSANGSCPEPGDVVCVSINQEINKSTNQSEPVIEKCSLGYASNAIGIISTNPGFTLGGLDSPNSRKVALAGRVPLKVSTKNGPIKIGDHLTTSDIPGVAVKATTDGPSIAIALEDFTDENLKSQACTERSECIENPKLIIAFVKVSWWLPSLITTSTDSNSMGEPQGLFAFILGWFRGIGVTIESGIIKVANFVSDNIKSKKIETEQLCIGSTCVTEGELRNLLVGQQPIQQTLNTDPNYSPPLVSDPNSFTSQTDGSIEQAEPPLILTDAVAITVSSTIPTTTVVSASTTVDMATEPIAISTEPAIIPESTASTTP